MSNRISGILLMTLIALCVIIIMEARSGVPSADNLKGITGGDKGARVSEPVRVTLPPLGALSETVERPLFSESRRPSELELNGAPVSPTAIATGPAAKFAVSAIVITEDERAVLITHPQSGEPTRVAEGELIAGWRLDNVENDRVVFSKDGEIQEVALRTFGPPPPRRPLRPAPTVGANPPKRALRRTLSGDQSRPLKATQEPASER